MTFAYVTLDLSKDRVICTHTVTVNPLEEEAVEDGNKIVQELPEILLQVNLKDRRIADLEMALKMALKMARRGL